MFFSQGAPGMQGIPGAPGNSGLPGRDGERGPEGERGEEGKPVIINNELAESSWFYFLIPHDFHSLD